MEHRGQTLAMVLDAVRRYLRDHQHHDRYRRRPRLPPKHGTDVEKFLLHADVSWDDRDGMGGCEALEFMAGTPGL